MSYKGERKLKKSYKKLRLYTLKYNPSLKRDRANGDVFKKDYKLQIYSFEAGIGCMPGPLAQTLANFQKQFIET